MNETLTPVSDIMTGHACCLNYFYPAALDKSLLVTFSFTTLDADNLLPPELTLSTVTFDVSASVEFEFVYRA